MGNVSRDEIADAVYEGGEDLGSKAGARRVVKAVFDAIEESMGEGDTVVIPGFGKFTVKERSARTGRNPHTGEALQIEAKLVPGFKAGTALKSTVAG